MIYKTLKKVSDYCQLVDKRNFPETTMTNGITFTNNGDGTITANGTAIKNTYFTILSADLELSTHKKYLLTGCPSGGSSYTYFVYVDRDGALFNLDTGNGSIGTPTKSNAVITIFVRQGLTLNNLVFKPQLFDLTEMYGEGNEPTTVEQFRQDFPDELYDYKPYCFVKSYKTLLKVSDNKIITSYKKSLVCTTKNLFDISKVPTISGNIIVKDNSICSYAYPAVTNDTNLLSIFKSLKPNTNYTMSATVPKYLGTYTGFIAIKFTDADAIFIYGEFKNGYNKSTFSLTQEQINNITYVYFYGRDESSGGPVIWSNIQIEEGDTATEYHPYGYL